MAIEKYTGAFYDPTTDVDCFLHTISSLIPKTRNKICDDLITSPFFLPLNATIEILNNPFYKSIGMSYKNITEALINYIENVHGIDIPYVGYAFLVDDTRSYLGACGAEYLYNIPIIRLYINPLAFYLEHSAQRRFEDLVQVAIHEVAHATLYTINPDQYPLVFGAEHPTEFNMLCFDMNGVFYNRLELFNKLNVEITF